MNQHDPIRGSGRTSRQLLSIPPGGGWIYVVATHRELHYTNHLAHHLGRDDLEVHALSWFGSMQWRGLRPAGMVVDHHVREWARDNSAWHAIDRLLEARDYFRSRGIPVL